MRLTDDEKRMLDGHYGEAARMALAPGWRTLSLTEPGCPGRDA